ncbi:MAG TPA: hypothetical protein VIL04_05960 [Solirubrobacterales bacterium]
MRLVPVAVGRTAGAVGGLADSGFFVGITRSRIWIGLLAFLLIGIVGLNVATLSLNAKASKIGALTDELKRENSALRGDLSGVLSNEHLQREASKLGLAYPSAGAVLDLRADPGDAAAAAKRLRRGEITVGDASVPVVPETGYTEPADATTVPPTDTAATTTPTAETAAPTQSTAPPSTDSAAPAAPSTSTTPSTGATTPSTGGALTP